MMDNTIKSCIIATGAMTVISNELKKFIATRSNISCPAMSKILVNYLMSYSDSEIFKNTLSGQMTIGSDTKIEGGEILMTKFENGNSCLQSDVFQCTISIGYENCWSYYVRSLMIHPTRYMNDCYNFMVMVEMRLLESLKPGAKLSEVYKIVLSFARDKNPKLAKHLNKDFGFIMKSNNKSAFVSINADSKEIAEESAIFAISIQLKELEESGQKFNLYNGDTALVKKMGPAHILTLHHNKFQKFIMEGEIEKEKKIERVNQHGNIISDVA